MAVTIVGTQGTVTEADWAELMSIATQKYVRDRIPTVQLLPNEAAPTSVLLDQYKAVGAGVLVRDPDTTTIPVPAGAVNGRWYLLVLRRSWGLTPSAQHVWHASTSSSGPNPPAAFPAARQVVPGVVDDEPVLWYKHSTSGDPLGASIRLLTNLAGGAVASRLALWDGAEQGLTHARIATGIVSAEEVWRNGASEFFGWDSTAARWEPYGSDTITLFREWVGLQSNGSVLTLQTGITGIFEYPPMVIPCVTTTSPQLCDVSATANSHTATVYFHRSNATETTVRALIVGVPKRG